MRDYIAMMKNNLMLPWSEIQTCLAKRLKYIGCHTTT